jgi:hypothetical protein
MWHVWGTGEVHTAFWRENLRETDHLEGLSVNETMILKWIFENWGGEAWTELI